MARYSLKTKLKDVEVIKKARAYFGEGGLGLKVEDEADCCVRYEGGGGHVFISTQEQPSGKTEVTLETREWDYPVKQFMQKVK